MEELNITEPQADVQAEVQVEQTPTEDNVTSYFNSVIKPSGDFTTESEFREFLSDKGQAESYFKEVVGPAGDFGSFEEFSSFLNVGGVGKPMPPIQTNIGGAEQKPTTLKPATQSPLKSSGIQSLSERLIKTPSSYYTQKVTEDISLGQARYVVSSLGYSMNDISNEELTDVLANKKSYKSLGHMVDDVKGRIAQNRQRQAEEPVQPEGGRVTKTTKSVLGKEVKKEPMVMAPKDPFGFDSVIQEVYSPERPKASYLQSYDNDQQATIDAEREMLRLKEIYDNPYQSKRDETLKTDAVRREELASYERAKKDFDRLNQRSSKSLQDAKPIIDNYTNALTDGIKWQSFRNKEGDFDAYKVNDAAKKIAQQNGFSEDGPAVKYIESQIIAKSQFKKLQPEIEARYAEKQQEILRGLDADQAKIAEEFKGVSKTLAETSLQIEGLGKEISTLVATEADPIRKDYELSTSDIKTGYAALDQDLQNQISQNAQLYNSGQRSFQEATQFEQQLIAQREELLNQTNIELGNQFDLLTARLNEVNSKYKQRYERQKNEISSAAEAKFQKEFQQFAKDKNLTQDAMIKLKAAYKDAYDATMLADKEKRQAFEKEIGEGFWRVPEFAKFGSALFSQDGGVFDITDLSYLLPINTQVAGIAFENSLGTALEAIGNEMGFEALRIGGRQMALSSDLLAPKEEISWGDLTDWISFQKSAGNLAGSMAPGLLATAAATAITGGLGVGTIGTMTIGGLVGWQTESMQMASQVYLDTLKETGDGVLAQRRADKMWDFQKSIILSYGLEALPFMGILRKGTSQIGRRIILGAAAELGTETVLQEFPQTVAEEAIMMDKDAMTAIGEAFKGVGGYLASRVGGDTPTEQEVKDYQLFKRVVIETGPVAVLGGGGQAISSLREQRVINAAEKIGKAYMQKAVFGSVSPVQTNQFLSDLVSVKGVDFATTMVTGLFTSGQITEVEKTKMLEGISKSETIIATAKRQKMNKTESSVFSFLNFLNDDMVGQIEQESDPNVKSALESKQKAIETDLKNFLITKKSDLFVLEYADGSQTLMAPDDITTLSQNQAFINELRDGTLSIKGLSAEFTSKQKPIVDDINARMEASKQAAPEEGLTVEEIKRGFQEQLDNIDLTSPKAGQITSDIILDYIVAGNADSVEAAIDSGKPVDGKEASMLLDSLYTALARVDESVSMTAEEKADLQGILEPLISKIEGYDNITEGTTIKVAERQATARPVEDARKVKDQASAIENSRGKKGVLIRPSRRNPNQRVKEKVKSIDPATIPIESEVSIVRDDAGEIVGYSFTLPDGNELFVDDPGGGIDLALMQKNEIMGAPPQLMEQVFEDVMREVEITAPTTKTETTKPTTKAVAPTTAPTVTTETTKPTTKAVAPTTAPTATTEAAPTTTAPKVYVFGIGERGGQSFNSKEYDTDNPEIDRDIAYGRPGTGVIEFTKKGVKYVVAYTNKGLRDRANRQGFLSVSIPIPEGATQETIDRLKQQAQDNLNKLTPLAKDGLLDSRTMQKAVSENIETAPIETTKPTENAVQEQAAGQVPVQPKAGVSETMAEGKPQAEPQVTPTEGQAEQAQATTEEKKEVNVGDALNIINALNEQTPGQTNEAPRTYTTKNIDRAINDARKAKDAKLEKALVDAKAIMKALGKKDTKVVIHFNQGSYTQSVVQAGGEAQTSGSSGFVISKDGNTIHLNLPKIKSNEVVLHEGAHPVLDWITKNNPERIDALYTELESLAQVLPGVNDAIAFSKKYGNTTQAKKEAIVQFMALVADGTINLSEANPTFKQKAIEFIKKLLQAIGIDFNVKISDDASVVELAKRFTESVKYGREISVASKTGVGTPQMMITGGGRVTAENVLTLEERGDKKVIEVADAFEKAVDEVLSPQSDPNSRVSRFLKNAYEDLRYFLSEYSGDTGLDWYTNKVKEFNAKLEEASDIAIENGEMPLENSLKIKENMDLFKVVLALSSIGVNPKENVKAAFEIWKTFNQETKTFSKYQPGLVSVRTNIPDGKGGFKAPSGEIVKEGVNFIDIKQKNGKIIRIKKSDLALKYDVTYIKEDGKKATKTLRFVKDTGKSVVFRSGPTFIKINKEDIIEQEDSDNGTLGKGWTTKGNVVAINLNRLEDVLSDHLNIKDALDWINSKHPINELRKYNKGVPDVDGKKGKINPKGERLGSYIIGEKLGAFHQNVAGTPTELTMDLWWSRTWNRYMGTLIGKDKKGNPIIQETPRTDNERNIMREAAKIAADSLGLEVHELQAALWYLEQQMYKRMGAAVESYSFVDGINQVLLQYGKSEKEIQPERYGIDSTEADKRRADAANRAANILYGESGRKGQEGPSGERLGEGPQFSMAGGVPISDVITALRNAGATEQVIADALKQSGYYTQEEINDAMGLPAPQPTPMIQPPVIPPSFGVEPENGTNQRVNSIYERMALKAESEGNLELAAEIRRRGLYNQRSTDLVKTDSELLISSFNDDIEAAADFVMNNPINGDIRTYVLGQRATRAKQAAISNPTAENLAARNQAIYDFAAYTTDLGQATNAIKLFEEDNPDLFYLGRFSEYIATLANNLGNPAVTTTNASKVVKAAKEVVKLRKDILNKIANVISEMADDATIDSLMIDALELDKAGKDRVLTNKMRNGLKKIVGSVESKKIIGEKLKRLAELGVFGLEETRDEVKELIRKGLAEINPTLQTPLDTNEIQEMAEMFMIIYEEMATQKMDALLDKAFNGNNKNNAAVINAVMYGALDTSNALNKFGQKFGLSYITPQMQQQLRNAAQQVANARGNAARSVAQAAFTSMFNNFIYQSKPAGYKILNSIRSFFSYFENIFYNTALFAINTFDRASQGNILRTFGNILNAVARRDFIIIADSFKDVYRKKEVSFNYIDRNGIVQSIDAKTRLVFDDVYSSLRGIPRLAEVKRAGGLNQVEIDIRNTDSRLKRRLLRTFAVPASRIMGAVDATVMPLNMFLTKRQAFYDVLKAFYKDKGITISKKTIPGVSISEADLRIQLNDILGVDTDYVSKAMEQAVVDVMGSKLWTDLGFTNADEFPVSDPRLKTGKGSRESKIYNEFLFRTREILDSEEKKRLQESFTDMGYGGLMSPTESDLMSAAIDNYAIKVSSELAFLGTPRGSLRTPAEAINKLSNKFLPLKYAGLAPLFTNAAFNSAGMAIRVTPGLNIIQYLKYWYTGTRGGQKGSQKEFGSDYEQLTKIDQNKMLRTVLLTNAAFAIAAALKPYDDEEEEIIAINNKMWTGSTPLKLTKAQTDLGYLPGRIYINGKDYDYRDNPLALLISSISFVRNFGLWSFDPQSTNFYAEDDGEIGYDPSFIEATGAYGLFITASMLELSTIKDMSKTYSDLIEIFSPPKGEDDVKWDKSVTRFLEKKGANIIRTTIPYSRFVAEMKTITDAIMNNDKKLPITFVDNIVFGHAIEDTVIKTNGYDFFGRPVKDAFTLILPFVSSVSINQDPKVDREHRLYRKMNYTPKLFLNDRLPVHITLDDLNGDANKFEDFFKRVKAEEKKKDGLVEDVERKSMTEQRILVSLPMSRQEANLVNQKSTEFAGKFVEKNFINLQSMDRARFKDAMNSIYNIGREVAIYQNLGNLIEYDKADYYSMINNKIKKFKDTYVGSEMDNLTWPQEFEPSSILGDSFETEPKVIL